jgi:hypothetical protein
VYGVITVAMVMLLRDFGLYGMCMVLYNHCHGNGVKGFWALLNVYCVITVAMVMLFRDFGLYGIFMVL